MPDIYESESLISITQLILKSLGGIEDFKFWAQWLDEMWTTEQPFTLLDGAMGE